MSCVLGVLCCGRLDFEVGARDGSVAQQDAAGDSSIPSIDASVTNANLAFVTSREYSVEEIGGLLGADALCTMHAGEAGLAGEYRAWLSSSDEPAIDRFEGTAGWLRLDGRLFVRSMEGIASARIFYPVGLDETGQSISSAPSPTSGPYYWTGTRYNGSASSSTCGSFLDPLEEGSTTIGLPTGGSLEFTEAARSSCDASRRLLCLGVGRDVELAPPEPGDGRLAFATLESFSGNLGGLEGADAECQNAADAVGLGGTFRALLGTSTILPGARFSSDGAAWVRLDGVRIAPTAEEVLSFQWQAPINVDQHGDYHWFAAFTGGIQELAPASETCEDWTSSADTVSATFRSLSVADDRTRIDTCNKSARLWCLEE